MQKNEEQKETLFLNLELTRRRPPAIAEGLCRAWEGGKLVADNGKRSLALSF